jgi:acetamidase/formamidase
MAHHVLSADAPYHGYFSTELAPVLTIRPGDTVEFSVPDAAWNTRPRRFEGDVPERIARPGPEHTGHCLAGPFFVEGAKPGHVLEIQVQELNVGKHGWTSAGGWSHEVHRRLGTDDPGESILFWELNGETSSAKDQHGHSITLHPFLGVMGMPTNVSGIQPTPPPRRSGGNLDCKELVVGSRLFLPVEVDGALVSAGDGHAAQGDGEVCVTAIECPMEKVVLGFDLLEEMRIKAPRATLGSDWITLGVSEDLDEAVFMALDEMLDLMGEKFGLDRKTALALASVVVDVRVTQIVNGTKGAHAILRGDAFTQATI